jgi:hypothetical protein
MDGSGIYGNLVRPGIQQPADILHGPHTAPNGKRHEYPFSGPSYHIDNDVTLVGRSGNIQKCQFIRTLTIIASVFYRVTGVSCSRNWTPDDPAPFTSRQEYLPVSIPHLRQALSAPLSKPSHRPAMAPV